MFVRWPRTVEQQLADFFVGGLRVISLSVLLGVATLGPVWAEPAPAQQISNTTASSDSALGPANDVTDEAEPPDPCQQYDDPDQTWLDRNQVRIYRTVCGTAAWFDGFFGDNRYDEATGETYGRLGVGTFWDERDNWDTDVKLRAKYALPSLRRKASLLVGSGEEEEIIEERVTSEQENLPAVANTDRDDSLYVGFGFQGFESEEGSLDYSVGLRLRSSPEVYAKTTYRKAWQFSQNNMLRMRPIVYWRSDEGFGSTLNLEYDKLINDALLFRWGNFGNVSEDSEVDGVDWGTTWSLFQVLSNRRALTYSVFVRGETGAEVRMKNYGLEFRYRKRILREWLFIEYLGRISWPREFFVEERETNLGAGIRFEAYFGPAPESWVR